MLPADSREHTNSREGNSQVSATAAAAFEWGDSRVPEDNRPAFEWGDSRVPVRVGRFPTGVSSRSCNNRQSLLGPSPFHPQNVKAGVATISETSSVILFTKPDSPTSKSSMIFRKYGTTY